MRRVAAAAHDPARRRGGCTARRTRRGRRSDGVEAKVSAPVVRRSYFGAWRRRCPSMSTARRDDVKLSHSNFPSAPRIGMLCVAALHGADISRTAARKRQMRAPRGCFRPACLGLLHLDTRFFRRVSRVPNTSSRTVSYGQKPLPYNTSTRNLLVSGSGLRRPSFSPQ